MKDPYKILGVKIDATNKEIKSAYRKKSKKAHPDRGGSSFEFQELKEAYDILKDPIIRKIYDETGNVSSKKFSQSVYNQIHKEFFGAIGENYDANIDIVGVILHNLQMAINDCPNKINNIDSTIEKLGRWRGKVKLKEEFKGATNIFEALIEGSISDAVKQKKFWIELPEKLEKLKLIINQYESGGIGRSTDYLGHPAQKYTYPH